MGSISNDFDQSTEEKKGHRSISGSFQEKQRRSSPWSLISTISASPQRKRIARVSEGLRRKDIGCMMNCLREAGEVLHMVFPNPIFNSPQRRRIG